MTPTPDPIKTIEDIFPCPTGCGSNADPADGFGYCTCGAEEQRKAINNELLRARISERKEVALNNYRGKTFSDSTNYKAKFDKFVTNNEKRIAKLKQSQTEGGE